MIKMIGALILVVGLVGATVSATPTGKCAYSNYRLPQHIVPKNYDLFLDVNTEQHTYDGSMKIKLEIGKNNEIENDNIIVLNVHQDVQVMGVTYVDLEASSSTNQIKVNKICRDDENELLVITLANNLASQDRGHLSMSFQAKIRDDYTGIYRRNYTTREGLYSYHVSTDFKPNRARRAFPCFDEPAFKATFTVELTHDPAKVALANMALLSEEEKGDSKVSKFKTSPLMSIHTVAFAIGEFEYIEKTTLSGSPAIRAYTPVGKSQQAQFALDTAVEVFTYLEDYFGVQLPLEKIDMFTGVGHSGVRGNWGLMVCNESLFLFDDENSSPINKGYIAQTVVRGLSHQWFGNLVTLKWWNDLWLQEGINTWLGYNVTNQLYPKLQWELNYLIELHQKALELDSREDTQHIRITDVGKKSIDSTFAKLVHMKSTAIIKFLHDVFVGPDKFRDGIRQYMREHKFRNAEASDLWMQLQDVSELQVDQFIKSWTEQSGHPLVSVQAAPDGTKRLLFEQKRDGPASATADNQQTWTIPVTIVLSDGHRPQETRKFTLDQHKQMMDLPDWFNLKHKDHWVKVNDDSRGFYRVQYSVKNLLRSLRNAILSKKLSTSNKIGLLDDYMALYRNDQLKDVNFKFSQLVHWLRGETEGVILGRYARALSLIRFHSGEEVNFKRDLFLSAYKETPLSSEKLSNAGTRDGMSLMDSYGLVDVFSILLELDHKPLVKDARALFFIEENKVAPIIRELVYRAVAKHGSDIQKRKLRMFSSNPNNCVEEKNRLDVAIANLSKRKEFPGSSSSVKQDSTGKRHKLD